MIQNAETAQKLVSAHKAVFTHPPLRVPSDKHVDGPLLGNGDVGVVFAGPPEHLRLLISKNDFWKSKHGFPNGGPRPIGGLDLLAPSLLGASYHVEVDLYHGELTGVFSKPGLTLELRAWVSATQNVLIVETTVASGTLEIVPDLWVCTGDGSTSRVSADTEPATISRRYEWADLAWPCEAAIALKRIEERKRSIFVAAVGSSFDAAHPTGGRDPSQEAAEFRLLSPEGAISNSPGQASAPPWVSKKEKTCPEWAASPNGLNFAPLPADPTSDVVRHVAALDGPALETLRLDHRRWWANFWSESWVEIHDELIERHYYGAQYILGSCSRNPGFPPGLWGNWITTDTPAWAGDYHLNYNHQAPFWGLYSSNHLQLADGYDAPLLEYIEKGKTNAKEFLGVRGIYYEVGIGPRGFCSSLFRDDEENPGTIRAAELEHGHQFWGQKSNALFGAVPMILRWNHTRDLDYACRIYPYLVEVANFWEDYLSFEGGRYVIHNDCYCEAGPWMGADWEDLRNDFNPLISLGLLRMFFQEMIEIASCLDLDRQRHSKWKHILDHLSDFPLAERGGRLLPKGSEDGPNRNTIGTTRLTFHAMIWPSSVVGRDRLPNHFKMLQETASKWGEEVWVHHGNSFDTVPPGAARLGIDPSRILEMMRAKIDAHALPNLLIEQEGGGIETCGGITAGINEMLLQSYEGVLRLFPCWPVNQDARFARLRAYGAFVVSAELTNAVVHGVSLRSDKGSPCTIDNPWPDCGVRLVRNGRQAESLAGERLHFSTAILEEIELMRVPESRVTESGEGANVSK